MTRLTAEDYFNIEVLKLMLQLAWADGRVDPKEAGVILGAARSWGVPETEVSALKRAMENQSAVSAPDLALLQGRSEEALMAVRAVIASDGRLDPAEEQMLKELRIILEPAS